MSKDGQAISDQFQIKPLREAGVAKIEDFVAGLNEHDLLFLSRDIRNPRVLAAWRTAADEGQLDSFVAVAEGAIVATAAVLRDPLSWSAHVADIRLIVLPVWRDRGIGRKLLETAIEQAISRGATKLTARMTPDQRGAITLFEEMGFRGEALLIDHVCDQSGTMHDLAILSLDVARSIARRGALGE